MHLALVRYVSGWVCRSEMPRGLWHEQAWLFVHECVETVEINAWLSLISFVLFHPETAFGLFQM